VRKMLIAGLVFVFAAGVPSSLTLALLPPIASASTAPRDPLRAVARNPVVAASRWAIQSTPNPAGARQNELRGVACATATSCTAVGDFANPGPFATLAERWDGAKWRIQRTLNPADATGTQLSGISCVSATACEAVGFSVNSADLYRTLAERWDGTKWRIQRTPNPAGANPSYLEGVSCTSATACTAVGVYESHPPTLAPLAERWNGTRWTIQRTPNPGGAAGVQLNGVSCPAIRACTAVGYYANSDQMQARTLAERWNGTKWTVQATANPTAGSEFGLYSVSCPSTTACTAVGDFFHGTFVTLAEQWNGARWTLQATPNGTQESSLTGISCSSATACTAVGAFANSSFLYQTLAERWTGTRWTIQSTPDPAAQAPGVSVGGVSCTSATACTSVGNYYNTAGRQVTLAERYS
jgi:hypothetical protein